MARHDEKTSAGREKMLSGGDTGDRLAEVNEVLGCLVVQYFMVPAAVCPSPSSRQHPSCGNRLSVCPSVSDMMAVQFKTKDTTKHKSKLLK